MRRTGRAIGFQTSTNMTMPVAKAQKPKNLLLMRTSVDQVRPTRINQTAKSRLERDIMRT